MMGKDAFTDQAFDEVLTEIVNEQTPGSLLHVPGVYEILSEEFNNEVLRRLEARRAAAREDDEDA